MRPSPSSVFCLFVMLGKHCCVEGAIGGMAGKHPVAAARRGVQYIALDVVRILNRDPIYKNKTLALAKDLVWVHLLRVITRPKKDSIQQQGRIFAAVDPVHGGSTVGRSGFVM